MIDRKKYLILTSILLISFFAKAQEKEKDNHLPKGNDSFVEQKYQDNASKVSYLSYLTNA
jgi:hypothetical protein